MQYIANESDMSLVVGDFIKFCEYVKDTKPFATQKGDLSTKGCYEANRLLRHARKDAKQTDRIYHYPSVALWFSVAKEVGLIAQFDAKGSKTIYDITEQYAVFKEMNVYTQYLLILNVWYCFVDIEILNAERGSQFITSMLIDSAFRDLIKNGCEQWLLRDKNHRGGYGENMVQLLFEYSYKTAHVLMDLGLIIFEESGEKAAYFNHPTLSKIKPTPLGLCIMKACSARKYAWFNVHISESIRAEEVPVFEAMGETIESGTEEFLTPFLDCVPEGTVDVAGINKIIYGYEPTDESSDDRVFEFKVSLGKKCYRIIRCLPHHTFEDLHSAIQDAFEFDDDHLYSFYLSGEKYSDYAVHAPYAFESPSADAVCLGDVRLRDKQRILYLFDYGDRWEFDVVVALSKQGAESFNAPEIIKSVGDAPEQYPDYSTWA